MIRSKLRLLGLFAVALGVMVMSASVSQASLFEWKELDGGGPIEGEKDSADLTLLTKLLGKNFAITCTSFKLIGVNLGSEGKLTEGGKVLFEGCEVYGKGTLEEPLGCQVRSTGKAIGTVETNELKGELVLHELGGGGSELLTKIEPKTAGGNFATALTEECIMPESNPVRGVLYLKDGEKKAESHLAKHLVEQGPLTSLYVGAHTAEHLETSIDGSVWVSFDGVTWGGVHNPSGSSLFTWEVLDGGGPIEGEKDSADLTLLTKLLGKNFAITCTSFKLIGVNLGSEGKLTEGGKVLFEGCEVYGKGTLEEPLGCQVRSTGKAIGTVETNELKGELVLHELGGGGSELLTKIEPKTAGGNFATALTEECIMPESNPVRGVLYLKDGEKKAESHLAKHLVEQGPLTSLYVGAHTAEHLETSIDGSVWVSFDGVTWGGVHNPSGSSLFTWEVLDGGGPIEGEKDSADLTLLTKLLGKNFAITCTSFKLIGVNLGSEGKLTEGGKVLFEGCEVYGKGTLEEPLGCQVRSTGKAIGTVETNELKGELVLHELGGGGSELLTKIEPKTAGGNFATALTEECIMPESNPVRGVLYLKDGEKKAESHLAKHLVEQGPLTSLYVGAHTAEHLETSIDGSVWVSFDGVTWGGVHNLP